MQIDAPEVPGRKLSGTVIHRKSDPEPEKKAGSLNLGFGGYAERGRGGSMNVGAVGGLTKLRQGGTSIVSPKGSQ